MPITLGMLCIKNDESKELMAKAHETNEYRDRVEKEAGWVIPSKCPIDVCLLTAMTAIGCGIEMRDWNCVAEGLDMLITLHNERF